MHVKCVMARNRKQLNTCMYVGVALKTRPKPAARYVVGSEVK